ncbi:MAG: response regulator [Deltaproteobacteria bacterium]|nr:response regulator [Deltaproteobacteria bacterium]
MNGMLFIDDEEGIRRSITRALRHEEYNILLAKDGDEGLALFEKHMPEIDIVISDYKMPGRDGMETLCQIAKMNPEITRILLTGYATLESAIRATNEGIDGFLTKPFDNMELRLKIREIALKKRLQQFVPIEIYEKIKNIRNPLQPKKQQATILFTDIRGFTSISQNIPPDTLAQYLNEHYFSPLGEIAFQYNGTVDKHIGDSIMIIYGAPVTRNDDPVRAVEAAIAMQKAIQEHNAKLAFGTGIELNMGIGICTGEVVTGIFGSLRKKEYTAIGTPVNIASRLEKLAGNKEILISESTYQEIKGSVPAEPLEPIFIKGIEDPIPIYRVKIE